MGRKGAGRLSILLLFILSLCSAAQIEAPQKGETSPSGEPFKFESKVRIVLVPVLVLDERGRAVAHLTKENFQIFDRGKQQVISGFTAQVRAGESREMGYTPDAPIPESPATPEKLVAQRHIVFLFDDLHLGTSDLVHARKAAGRMLAGSLNSSDLAAVLSISGRVNTGFTHDQAKLQNAIMELRQDRAYTNPIASCPNVDHYTAYMIQYLRDPEVLDAVAEEATRKCLAPDMQVGERMARAAAAWEMGIGEQGTGLALDVIRQVIRQMGALPGQRTLILISSGFIALTPEAMEAKARVIDMAAQANVTVSALDARGLDTLMFDMSNPLFESQVHERVRHYSLTTYGDVLEELASGTGGTYFHNSNDLEGGFKSLTKAPEYLYLLEFSPEHLKPDGTYHVLKVKVDAKGAKIQTRRGYFAEKPPQETKKHTN